MLAHSGQSRVWLTVEVDFPAASMLMTFMEPEPEHTSCKLCGLTMGEAIATPSDNANHTSTKRAIRWALRRVCMAQIITAHIEPRLVLPNIFPKSGNLSHAIVSFVLAAHHLAVVWDKKR